MFSQVVFDSWKHNERSPSISLCLLQSSIVNLVLSLMSSSQLLLGFRLLLSQYILHCNIASCDKSCVLMICSQNISFVTNFPYKDSRGLMFVKHVFTRPLSSYRFYHCLQFRTIFYYWKGHSRLL